MQHPAPTRGFASGLIALGLSDLAQRVSRLAVVVVVARSLDPAAIGTAAAALAASEILKALTETGVNQRVIAAPEADLEAACLTARRIHTAWCLGLFTLQLAVGAGIALASGDAMAFVMVAILAGEYLFMPAGLVSCALAMREGRLTRTAAIGGAQVVVANLLTAILALLIAGPLALVLPRLLSAPVWTIGMRRLRPWRPAAGVAPLPLRHFTGYGAAVLGVELVKAARLQADKLVIGLMLGPEALGHYFLAFNAGLGLASSFANAFGVALFPWLARAADRAQALRRALGLSICVLSPVVVAQSLLAPWYVPLLYGAKWSGNSDVVSVLCLAAIPALIWTATAQWLRAEGRPAVEFTVTCTTTVLLIANTALTARHGLQATAIGYLAVATVTQLGAALPSLIAAFGPRTQPRLTA
ncbi:oligosaccharide flippase family protein [Frigidibacter sp. MR17.14]|uniref:oligosaccharide flippase family protein n=1 Tax=Frigidibacter sp. MR17.14 TaxID=3126509 RepID=UPI0030130CA5